MKFNINGKIVEVENDALSKAIEEKTESIDITSEGLTLRTKEEDETFVGNIKEEGTLIGAEIGRKEVLRGLDIVSDGAHRTDEATIEAIKGFSTSGITKALEDAKIEPNKQIEAKDKDILQLQQNITTLTGENETLQGEFGAFKNTQIKSNKLSGLIPENTVLPREQVLLLMNATIKTDVNEHGVVFGVGVDGQPMKNPTDRSVLPIDDVVSGFFNDNPHLLKSASGGADGGDSGGDGNGKQTLEAFTKEMGEAGHAINSPEFINQMTLRQKAGTLSV